MVEDTTVKNFSGIQPVIGDSWHIEVLIDLHAAFLTANLAATRELLSVAIVVARKELRARQKSKLCNFSKSTNATGARKREHFSNDLAKESGTSNIVRLGRL